MGDVLLGQPGERHGQRDRLARELGERSLQRIGGRRVHVAAGADDHHPALGELAGDELQQQQRRLVRGVQVVEHEHERLHDRDPLQERRHGVEQAEARALGAGRGVRREVGEHVPQLRQQLGDVGCAQPELPAQRRGLGLAHVRAQRLHPRPVGGRASGLPAAADQDQRAACPRTRGELLGEPALADARLADEQEQPSAAGQRIVEAGGQLRQLALATDEGRRRRPSAPVSAGPRRRRAAGPGSGSRARARAAARPARGRARRSARGEPRGRPPAPRPAGRSGTARASAAPGTAPGRDARRPAARAARAGWRGGRARARPRSAARRRRRAPPPGARSRAGRTLRRPGPPAGSRATAPAPPRASRPRGPGAPRPARCGLRPAGARSGGRRGTQGRPAARSRARASRSCRRLRALGAAARCRPARSWPPSPAGGRPTARRRAGRR